MSNYNISRRVQRTPRLSRRSTILTTSVLAPVFLLTVATMPVSATARRRGPVFATVKYVQSTINTALAPIKSGITGLQQNQTNQQTAITGLQNTQATHTQQISDLQSQVTSLQGSSSKQLMAYDANDNLLGLVMNNGTYSSTASVYNPSLNEFLTIATTDYQANLNGGTITNMLTGIFYQSSDCTGTPYSPTDSANGYQTNTVLPFGTVYYTYHTSDPVTSIVTHSRINSIAPDTCVQQTISMNTAAPLYPVTLPFPTPIAEPVQFKYQ